MAAQTPQALPKLQENASKTIGLISDTHVPARAREVPKEVYKVFENADYIVHAGDLVSLSVIDELEQLAPVLAVYGNMDGPNIRGKLPKLASFKIFDWKIGVTHNPGSPTNPIPPFIVKPSVALLKITKEDITPEIIQI